MLFIPLFDNDVLIFPRSSQLFSLSKFIAPSNSLKLPFFSAKLITFSRTLISILSSYSFSTLAFPFFGILSIALNISKVSSSFDILRIFLIYSSIKFLLLISISIFLNPSFCRKIDVNSIISVSDSIDVGPYISMSHWWKNLYLPACGSSYLQTPPKEAIFVGIFRSLRDTKYLVNPMVKSNLRAIFLFPLSTKL